MKIELVGALDYNALKDLLEERVKKGENVDELVELIREMETSRRSQIVAAAGRLSRFPGSVFESLGVSEENDMAKNVKFIKRVIGMGHDSITDHDYCVFAIQDVSPVIEQIIIAERFCSFTIKSRREVDFSKVGYYVPDFHDENGNVLENNADLQNEYRVYMDYLFDSYSELVDMGIKKEDARFVLPYSFYSNILMGIDAHVVKDMVIKFTKTKYANISEVREFGEKLYDIVKKDMPYLVDVIENYDASRSEEVDKFLDENVPKKEYEIIDKPKLIAHTNHVDDVILASALMRRYQYTFEEATDLLAKISVENPDFKEELMKKIAFTGDRLELTQVNFQFQVPLSFAVLTHLTRHRTHHILIPDFVPNVDLTQYKVPPMIERTCPEYFHDVFANTKLIHDKFKEMGVRDEDLIYFTLSGNMVNVVTNLDGKTLAHILGLRECTKAQWETRDMAVGMHKEITENVPDAIYYDKVVGPTCVTQGFCKEGKESCGRILALQKKEK